jgi:ATP-binding cassette, subfamily B, bacterial
MPTQPEPTSSKFRFSSYLKEFRERIKKGDTSSGKHSSAAKDAIYKDTTRSGGRHQTARPFFTLFVEFIKLLRKWWFIIALALVTLSLSTLMGLLPVYGTKIIIDSVLGDKQLILPWDAIHVSMPQSKRTGLFLVCLGMIAVAAISVTIGMWGRWQMTRISQLLRSRLRKRVFDHVMRLPLHRVYDLKSGGAVSMLREDAGGVGELLFGMIYSPWQAIVQLMGILFILLWTDWRMFLASMLFIPFVYFTHRTWISKIRPLFNDIRSTRQGIDAHATETFGGMRVVRGFSRQRHETGKYTNRNHFMVRQELLSWWWGRTIDIAWMLFMPVATAGLFFYGGLRVLEDGEKVHAGLLPAAQALTVGDLVMFLAYLGWLLGPLHTLVGSATTLQNSLAGLDRILNILSETSDMPQSPGLRRLDRSAPSGSLEFINVGYTYPVSTPYKGRDKDKDKDKDKEKEKLPEQLEKPKENKPVLQNISFRVEPGQMIAFVGRSGAGKTTLCNMVARFYDPTAGKIVYDGTDLKDIDLLSYRSLLGIVEQDTFLFDGSIHENISYSRPTATREEVISAAKQANADEFIQEITDAYDARIGERGVKLSGGQRQRLSIARAILADPRVLILDEATSNLDSHSERLIQASLQNLMKGRTSFVIAHRLSTIMHADKIIVLDQGHIKEVGTHQELMLQSGAYREMVDVQTRVPDQVLNQE